MELFSLFAAPCADDSTFSIPDVPPGSYQLVAWDANLDLIIGLHNFTVGPTDTSVDFGDVPVFAWFGRHEHFVFNDKNENGFWDEAGGAGSSAPSVWARASVGASTSQESAADAPRRRTRRRTPPRSSAVEIVHLRARRALPSVLVETGDRVVVTAPQDDFRVEPVRGLPLEVGDGNGRRAGSSTGCRRAGTG